MFHICQDASFRKKKFGSALYVYTDTYRQKRKKWTTTYAMGISTHYRYQNSRQVEKKS